MSVIWNIKSDVWSYSSPSIGAVSSCMLNCISYVDYFDAKCSEEHTEIMQLRWNIIRRIDRKYVANKSRWESTYAAIRIYLLYLNVCYKIDMSHFYLHTGFHLYFKMHEKLEREKWEEVRPIANIWWAMRQTTACDWWLLYPYVAHSHTPYKTS